MTKIPKEQHVQIKSNRIRSMNYRRQDKARTAHPLGKVHEKELVRSAAPGEEQQDQVKAKKQHN
jgi:hypothetical protein